MQLYGGINPYQSQSFGFGYIDTIQRQRTVTASFKGLPVSNQRDQMDDTTRHVLRMRKAMEAVKQLMPASESAQIEAATPASATSAANLDLSSGVPGTPTTLQSTEEVNTTATSYSTHGPEWSGSTAQVTISGNYNGSNGTDTLTFRVDTTGTHGQDDITIKVYDSNNNEIDKIEIKKTHPIDRTYKLNNKLNVTFGAGEFVRDDTFTIQVDDSQPTSFSPAQPDWTGSNAPATIGGVYDGSNGTDTLTFIADKSGTHGIDDLVMKVYDSNNNQIGQLDIKKDDPIDKQYSLSNGLTFTLGEGYVLRDTAFTIEVFDSVGTAVDPDNPLNGTGSSDPNLEAGLSVTDGSFQINDTTIAVNASDSINDVLDRINQSNAGVTATFDAASETVLLTQNTPGSTPDIVLSNDTSGFVAAVKLDGAVAIPGEDGTQIEDPSNLLAEMDSFSGVQSGSISVNGVSIDIDVNTDSLTDVLDRITASAADVTASYDSDSKRVTLTSNDAESQLILDSGTTNFFPAVEISDDTYEPVNDTIEVQADGVDSVKSSDLTSEYAEIYSAEIDATIGTDQGVSETPVTPADAKMLGDLVNVIADSMNALFDGSVITSSQGTGTEALQNEVRSAVTSWFDSEGPQFNTDFGIGFDFEKTEEGVFKFSQADRSRFEAALASPQSAASVHGALFGTESGGLFNQLHSTLTAAATGSESNADPTGLFLDLSI